jgi:threonine dehydratase
MEKSWRSGQVVTTAKAETIADGIGVRVPVPDALQDMRPIVDDVLLVDDATTLRAMRLLVQHTGLVVEPSGVVGVAAVMAHRARFAGQLVATPLCGGNVSREQFKAWFLADD